MSLKARLILVTIGMVAVSVCALSVLQLNSLISALLAHTAERSQTTAQIVKNLVLDRVAQESAARGARPATIEESKRMWTEILEQDVVLGEQLSQTLAQTRAVVEISVSGETGRVLASTNPARKGMPMTPRLPLRALSELGLLERIPAILSGQHDYESVVPLGVAGQLQPIFRIQVLISPVLLREALAPEMRRTGLVSLAALGLSILAAYWMAKVALRPLEKISQAIDRIVKGEPAGTGDPGGTGSREYAVVQEKLSVLGQQYRGAKEDASQLRSDVEQLLARLQQAESQMNLSARLAAINRLTGGVAHEIKNPLNSIALRLELLRAQVLEEVPEAQAEIDVIAQEVTRLDRVVRTFLDFTRPVDLKYEVVHLAQLVEETVNLMRPEAERSGIRLELELPPAKAVLKGDADLLRQALLNMVRNALDVMPDGGVLGVKVKRQAGQCAIAVSDSGPGIPESNREKIFELYFTTKRGGSGIGLAMAFRAAQLHGGTIEVTGEEGKGATFTMRLPASDSGARG